jgi:FtsP/CotA-like multicopper oxidase with cupredoxin domain
MYSDQDAGLSGPVIVYQPGQMETTMKSNRELIAGMFDNQESNSFLAEHNVQKYLPSHASKAKNEAASKYPKITSKANESIWGPQLVNTPWTPGITSDMLANFFPFNGYIYANNPLFEMCVGDNVIWYLWNMGFDQHVFHLHGHNFYINNMLKGATAIAPGEMQNAHIPDIQGPGLWQAICHFNTHFGKGMEANYIVHEGGKSCPLPPLSN